MIVRTPVRRGSRAVGEAASGGADGRGRRAHRRSAGRRRWTAPRPLASRGRGALGFLLLALVAGCDGVETVRPDVAVSISGEQVPYTDFEAFLAQQLGGELDLGAAALSGLFDQFLDEQLLVRLAVERGLLEQPVDERRAVAYLLRDFRYQPSERELRAYFTAHRSDFARPERVHLRLILVPDRGTAEQAFAALEGEDFAEVAARFSQGPTAHLGGDQGLLAREDLAGRYAEIVFALDAGEVSEIVEADYGFQIFQVTERLPASVMSFEEAEPVIRRELDGRRLDEQLASLLAEARERYNVRVFRGNLPFDYRGAYGQGAGGRNTRGPDPSETFDAET